MHAVPVCAQANPVSSIKTMDVETIKTMEIPAAEDAVLFRADVPEALDVLFSSKCQARNVTGGRSAAAVSTDGT
jgi:hypothetical protein